MDKLSERLAMALKFRKLSGAEVARRAGMKQQSIDQLLRGEVQSSGKIVQIAEALEVPARWLAGISKNPTRELQIFEYVLDMSEVEQDFLRAMYDRKRSGNTEAVERHKQPAQKRLPAPMRGAAD